MERWQSPEAENSSSAAYADHPSRSSLDYNTPLRSVRGNAINSASPFYKLSSELSRESLRIPGAVPFMWEQSPGHRKLPTGIASKPPCVQPQPAVPEYNTSSIGADPVKPTLATLFRQPSLKSQAMGSGVAPQLAAPAVPQIAPPPATDRARSSSARYSTVQRNTPTSSFAKCADAFADAVSDSVSDVLTATAGGASVDDSLMLSGPLKPPSTPSEARDFIMHRFLPAAHTIACEAPHTPSRRLMPLSNSAGPTPQTPSQSHGSFRDYGAAPACTQSWLKTATSPSVCTSYSSMPPARRRQHLEESFYNGNNDVDHSSEDEEEEPPSTPKACGIFPFRIHISLHIRHSTKRANPSSKHPHPSRSQQPHKESSKSTRYSHTPKRIMDVLQEDQSSGYEDESPVHLFASRHFEATSERSRITAIKQATIHSFSPKHLYLSESYYKRSSQPHQNVAQERSLSELNHEEGSEYGSYYDATSRFCSPSPVALHLVNGRASQANMLDSSLVANPQDTRSYIGSLNDNPHPAILRSTESHIPQSGLCNCNMHIANNNKPHLYHAQLASPSCLRPQPSHMSSSHESTVTTASITDQYWDAFLTVNQSEERTHIINNALYEHDERDITDMSCAIGSSTLTSPNVVEYSSNGTSVNESEAGDAFSQVHNSSNIYANKSASNLGRRDTHIASNGHHEMRDDELHMNHHMGNGDGQYGDNHNVCHVCHSVQYACNSNHCVGNGGGVHNMQSGCLHCIGDGGLQAWHGAHCVRNSKGAVHNAINGGFNEMKMGNHDVSSNLMNPPLPKSPTHSWLDRAMPLLVSANKSPNTSSRYKATVPAAENGYRNVQPAPVADSKWEALVKGSHFQPAQLRFSEVITS